jgi:uncharacterized membrane protein HdeD (DUF308 family)
MRVKAEHASTMTVLAEERILISELPRLWWMFSIRGLLTLTFSGICFFLSSSMTHLLLRPAGFVLLQVLFSFYIIATGFILLTGALYGFDAKLRHRKVLLGDALVNLAIGIIFFITLTLSMQWILVLFALHSMAVGIFYCVISLRMKHQMVSRLLLVAAGTVSVVAGWRFMTRRLVEMHIMTTEIALYTAVLGMLLILFSIALRTDRVPQPLLQEAT